MKYKIFVVVTGSENAEKLLNEIVDDGGEVVSVDAEFDRRYNEQTFTIVARVKK